MISRAKDITATLGGRWYDSYGVVRCLAHDDRNPSLVLRDGDSGCLLVHCYAGCGAREVLSEFCKRGLLEREVIGSYRLRKGDRPHDKREDPALRRIHAARNIWAGTVNVAGTESEAYLRSRHFNGVIPPTLRHHSKLRHPHAGSTLPAMVGAVTIWPSHQVRAIHRTYLTPDGRKAPLDACKLSLGPIGGGAVRLSPIGPEMIVAEGIETALSLLAATRMCVWAALSAGGIERLILPPPAALRSVVIAADHDARGLQAAENAALRWTIAGYTVRIAVPPGEGTDFNDIAEGPLDV